MNINIECTSLKINNKYTLEQNGLIGLLNTYNNQGVIPFATVVGAANVNNGITVLKQLVNQKVFYINETNENDSLVINIINGQPSKSIKLTNIDINKKLQLCYQLNELKQKTIMERSTDKKSFKFNLVNVCFDNYTARKLPMTELNSQEQFIEFMYSITPFETILSHDKQLSKRDFDNVFELISNYDFDLALINFAIDYAITTSKYHNLSYEFVKILLDSWKKHKITDVNSAIELIKLQKQASQSKGTKYVAPNYEQVTDKLEDAEVKISNLFMEDDSFE